SRGGLSGNFPRPERIRQQSQRWVRRGGRPADCRLELGIRSSPDASRPRRAASEVTMATIKVLLFAANPHGTAPLDLAREFREIDEEVRMGPFRHALELILVPGTRPKDLLRQLNENQPQIVHFSSHGDPDHLVLESGDETAESPGPQGTVTRSPDPRDMKSVPPDAAGEGSTGPGAPQRLSKSALVNVLRSCDEGNLRLVVLNACHSRSQAVVLTEVVDCV